MNWWLFKEQKKPERSEFPVLATVIIALFVLIISVAVRAVTWPGDKHVDEYFFTQSVVFPLLVLLCVVFLFLIPVSTRKHYEETRVAIAKEREEQLKQYARRHLIIAGWATLTPLDEPALNMLKLEGEFPLAPKTPIKIPREYDFEFTQTELLLNRLLAPLAEKLKTPHYRNFDSTLWVRGGDESCCDDLRRTFERLGLASNEIEYLQDCPDYSLVTNWIDSSTNYVTNRLLVIVDMHDEGSESKSMENASAFWLTNIYGKTEGEKPMYLYRPITDVTDVETVIPVYLYIAPVSSPKTLWYAALSKVEKYPLMQILDDRKLVANRLDVETSFGGKTAGYRWLVLALAADAVKYSQGDQLVAASDNNKLGLAAVSSRLTTAPSSSWYVDYMYPWQYGGLFGMFLSGSLFVGICGFGKPEAMANVSGWSVLFWALFPLTLFLSMGIMATWHAGNEAYRDMWGLDE